MRRGLLVALAAVTVIVCVAGLVGEYRIFHQPHWSEAGTVAFATSGLVSIAAWVLKLTDKPWANKWAYRIGVNCILVAIGIELIGAATDFPSQLYELMRENRGVALNLVSTAGLFVTITTSLIASYKWKKTRNGVTLA